MLITIFSTEEIPCVRYDKNSLVEEGDVSRRANDIANEMDAIMRDEARRLQIDSRDEMNERLTAAFEKHIHSDDDKFDGSLLATRVLNRMMGNLDEYPSLSFSITYLHELQTKKKKGSVKVVYVVSPYTKDEDGNEFVSPTLISGGTVCISLPHRKNTIPNPLFCPQAAAYMKGQWLDRLALWCNAIVQTINDALDANVYRCNQSTEGSISAMKNRVSTVREDHSSIADLIYQRYELNESMGKLLSNQIDGGYAKVMRRRDRSTATDKQRTNEDVHESEKESQMLWKPNSGTLRAHLDHYSEVMMRGLELGRDAGAFNYNKDKMATMHAVLKDFATETGRNFMGVAVFRIWLNHRRLLRLRPEWCEVIDSFYNRYS